MAKSIWDEFKDLFKTRSQREQEKRDGINDALDREKEIVEQLEELDKQYRDSLPKEEEPDLDALFPKDSGLKELEYEVDTDEEIEAKAAERAEADRESGKRKLEEQFKSDSDKISEKRAKAESDMQEDYQKLREAFDGLTESAKNDALEQGVARGSILSSTLGSIKDETDREASRMLETYNSEMKQLDDKLASLQEQLSAAMDELDINYALQLSEEIDKLKNERDKTVEKYEKYNRSVREKQQQYAIDREQDIEKFLAKQAEERQKRLDAEAAYESEHGYSGEKQKNYAERYDIAYDFYMSLDPEIAADALQASPNMQYYLGIYYDKLLKQLKSRTSNKKFYY